MLFRNILSLIAVLTAAGVPAGCSTTARLTRRQATAHLAQLSRTERQSKVRDDRPQVVRVERDSSDYYLVPVERDGQGEALGTVPIEEVVVVARVRSIPERRGRVTIVFNVELPKELLGRSRSVVITPFLHRQDEQIPLDDIIMHDWWVALLAHTFGQVGFVATPLVLYRQHGGNSMGTVNRRGLRFAMQKVGSDLGTRQALRQGALFCRIYGDEAEGDSASTLRAFQSLSGKRKLARIGLSVRHGLLKQTTLRRVYQLMKI